MRHFQKKVSNYGNVSYVWRDGEEGETVTLSVQYEKGDYGRSRGFYLNARLTERKIEGAFVVESFSIGAGRPSRSVLLQPVARGNASQLAKWAARLDDNAPQIAETYRAETQIAPLVASILADAAVAV